MAASGKEKRARIAVPALFMALSGHHGGPVRGEDHGTEEEDEPSGPSGAFLNALERTGLGLDDDQAQALWDAIQICVEGEE
jgi:hypothetical protein